MSQSAWLRVRVLIVIARSAGWAGAIAKALASEKIGWVGPPGDMHDAVLILGQQVEPQRLVMAHVPLLLQPLEARVVGVQLEVLIRQVGPKCQGSALRACTTAKSSSMSHCHRVGYERSGWGGYERSGWGRCRMEMAQNRQVARGWQTLRARRL